MSPQQPPKPEMPHGFSADSAPTDPPEHAARSRAGDAQLGRVLAQVRHLRDHCPWDARQTARSLRPYLLEEAHEVAEAIEDGDPDRLAGELGDLLLNVAFQVVVAEEEGTFDARAVVERLEAKMRARHPHVYGDASEAPDWEELKAREREEAAARGADEGDTGEDPSDPFEGVPDRLEPLSRALRVQQRAAGVGFDWPDVRGALAKLREEIGEVRELLDASDEGALDDGSSGHGPLDAAASRRDANPAAAGGTLPDARLEEEVGDLLFSAVNVARLADAHPGHALDAATRKFERRFERVLRDARRSGTPPSEATLEELEALWRAAKAGGGEGPAG